MSVVRLQVGCASFEPVARAPASKGGGLFGRVAAILRQWRRRARERSQLARLDERTLADIGLSRAQAEFIVNKPFWRE
jgi:uncharacterized protein YjiS (DUF1127 family)